MPKFWGYVSDEEYAAGCAGSTVYVYDKEGKKLLKLWEKYQSANSI